MLLLELLREPISPVGGPPFNGSPDQWPASGSSDRISTAKKIAPEEEVETELVTKAKTAKDEEEEIIDLGEEGEDDGEEGEDDWEDAGAPA